MARHKIVFEVAAPAASGTLAIANLVPPASGNFKLRRVIYGVRAATPISQGITLAWQRTTARGTQTTTVAPFAIDPNSIAPQSVGVDTAWSVQPTVSANILLKHSFNTQAMVDIPHEFLEELIVGQNSANGLALLNLANAFPAAHTLTVEVEIEE